MSKCWLFLLSTGLVLLTSVARPCLAQVPGGGGFATYLAELGLHREAVDELVRQDLDGQPAWHAAGLGYDYGYRLLLQGHVDASVEVLTATVDSDEDPQRAMRQRLLLGLALARQGRPAQAVATVGRVESFANDPALQAHAHAVRCLIHLRAAEPVMGTACARELLGHTADPEALDDLASDPDSAATWHGIASAVVPGLGQALGGAWADAGAGMLVNGGLLGATWNLFADGLYVDGTLLVIGMTVRYYAGNIQHGADAGRNAALKRRDRGALKLADQIAR